MENELDVYRAALQRLVNACYPIDMWMGGLWAKPPTDDARKEFADALAAAMGVVE